MQLDREYWKHKRVCVTGGTGFLGWHLVRVVQPIAAQVRIIGLQPRSQMLADQLRGIDSIFADIRDPVAVQRAVSDCDVVFHTAGTVGVWGPALQSMHEIHAEGTRNVLNALSRKARMVHTSSVVVIGASRHGTPLTEDSPFELQNLKVDYVHAKKAAEDIVLAAAAQGIDALAVNPGYLIGPDDYASSVMGRLCLRIWRGKVPLIPAGGLNFVDVRDVAIGHLLAAEHGERGRRYILGGDNLLMTEFVIALAGVRGMPSQRWLRMPQWLHGLLACGAELRAYFKGREPYPSLQHFRVSRYYWHYSSERARTELGYETRSLTDALADTHDWYCQTGQLAARPKNVDTARVEKPKREAA